MPKAPPPFKKPDALELFTDRVSEQAVLRQILAPSSGVRDDAVRLVTSFYGVGGVGKTTLCHQALANASREHPTGPIRVHTSFDDHRWTPASGFASVALELCQILSHAKVPTELTAALLVIWEKSTGEAGKIEDKWQLAVDWLDKAAEAAKIPGVSLLVQSYKYLRDKSRQAAVRQRMHELDLWPSEVNGRVTQLDVERKLPLSLYHDIRIWLNTHPGDELRMLLDGFERIQSKDNRQDAQRGVQEFIGYFATPRDATSDEAGGRFRVVIFGREKIRWDELYDDEDWHTYWSQHLLGGLAESDARIFLQKAADWRRRNGRQEVADRILASQDEILDAADEEPLGARAFYPYSLDLAVDMIDRAGGAGVELGRTPAELQERFLRYLDPREKRALMILAMAETFDEPLFDWLVDRKLVEYPRYSFRTEMVTGRSYLQKIGEEGDEWRFHRKMEEALQRSWLVTPAASEEGRRVFDELLRHLCDCLNGKAPRDWGQQELMAWNRGMEIIVTQGPEFGLIDTDGWTSLLAQQPWSITHYLLLTDRCHFISRIARICESRLGEQNEITCRFLYLEALHLQESGHDAEAEAQHRRVLQVRYDLLGPGHRDTLVSLNTVARLLSDAGHFAEAEQLCRKAVADCAKSLGPNDPETLQAHHNLGSLLESRGYSAEAQTAYERALDGRKATLGPMHHDTLKTMNNLGNVLHSRNLLEAAEEMYRGALEAKETALGSEHPSTLKTVHNLAGLLAERCQYDIAESMLRRAADGFAAAYGATHPDVITSIGRLGWFLLERGRAAEAISICDQAIAARVRTDGGDELGVTRLRQAKAKILTEIEMTAAAVQLFEEAHASLEKILGLTHPDTLDALDDLANVLTAEGRFSQSEPLYHQAIAGLMGTRGPQHPETLACRVRLARMLQHDAGRLDEAESMFRDILSEREQSLGPTHRDTLDAVDDLACLLTQQSRYTEAEKMFQHAAAGLSATLGEGHPETLSSRRRLALMYQRYSDFERAETIFQDVLATSISKKGQLHPDTLDVVDDLANLYALQGDYERAEEFYARAVSGLAATLGADHPQTLECRVRLAGMLQHGPEHLDRAATIFSEVLADRERLFGSTHPTTLDTLDDLAGLFAAQGDYERAEEYYGRAASGLAATLGDDHPQTLACRARLARMLQEVPGRLENAESTYRDILARLEGVLGATHPFTLEILNALAWLLRKTDRLAEALSLLRAWHSRSASCADAVRYKLACEECAAGNLDEARNLVFDELQKHPERRQAMLEDESLLAIRDFIEPL